MSVVSVLKNRKWSVFFLILFSLPIGLFLLHSFQEKKNDVLFSRILMEYAQEIVRVKKPTPPESARFYAYVSTMYYKVLESELGKKEFAITSTVQLINQIYPDTTDSNIQFLSKYQLALGGSPINSKSITVATNLLQQEKEDGFYTNQIPTRPEGSEYWVGMNPLGSGAVFWNYWLLKKDETDQVPPPIMYDSDEYKEAIAAVSAATRNRTIEQETLVNFWGGIPGTEAPSGIWQNRLWEVTKLDKWSDETYAYAQMILAQSLADSFISCWKVKFTYWTKRPNMYDPSLDVLMANPNFPGYVSGHSTISATAAKILVALLPKYAMIWETDAKNAMNSRLWAGIHFVHDNEAGFALGTRIGNTIISDLALQPIDFGLIN